MVWKTSWLKYGFNIDKLKFFTEDMILHLLIDYSNRQERNLLNKAIFGHSYKKIKTLTIEENLKTHFHAPFERMLNNLDIRINMENYLCEQSGLEKNNNLKMIMRKIIKSKK